MLKQQDALNFIRKRRWLTFISISCLIVIHLLFMSGNVLVLVSASSSASVGSSNSYPTLNKPARLPSGFHRSSVPKERSSSARSLGSPWTGTYRRTNYDPDLRPYRGVAASRKGSRGILSRRIIYANAFMYLLQVLNPKITQWGANIPNLIRHQPHRYFTPIFLHGSISHLAVNSFSLFSVGPALERILGNRLFLTSYLLSGGCGNALTSRLSRYPSVGASGAIFGLVGVYGVFVKRNEAFFGRSGEDALASIQRTTLLNLVMGMFSPVIDNWGHIGGLVGGMTISYMFGPRLYMMDNPSDGQILVNKPIVRVPTVVINKLGDLPERINLTKNQVMRKLRLEWHYMALPEKKRKKLKYRRYN